MLREAGFVKKKYSFKTYPVFFIRIFAAVLSFYSLLYAIVLTGIIFPLAVSYFCALIIIPMLNRSIGLPQHKKSLPETYSLVKNMRVGIDIPIISDIILTAHRRTSFR